MEDQAHTLPISYPVSSAGDPGRPQREPLEGRFVVLRPIDPEADAEALHAGSHGDAGTEGLWTYMPYGPFDGVPAMRRWLNGCATSEDPLFFAVEDRRRSMAVGMVSFLNIVPEMRRLELGHIWYSPAVQRSKVNTESVYLMLREVFDRLGYRRAEWKCDALNARSRMAALRLGFRFEGIFRQHMIVKGRNRDTAWFALIDGEWPAVKTNMERWLYEEGPERPALSLRALNEATARP